MKILPVITGGGAKLHNNGRIFMVGEKGDFLIKVQIITNIRAINPPMDTGFVAVPHHGFELWPFEGGSVVVDFVVIALLEVLVPGVDVEDVITGVEADFDQGVLIGGGIPVFPTAAAHVPDHVDVVGFGIDIVVGWDIVLGVLVEVKGVICSVVVGDGDLVPGEEGGGAGGVEFI